MVETSPLRGNSAGRLEDADQVLDVIGVKFSAGDAPRREVGDLVGVDGADTNEPTFRSVGSPTRR